MIRKEEIENIFKSPISDNNFHSSDSYCVFRIEYTTIELADLILLSNKLNTSNITIGNLGKSLAIKIDMKNNPHLDIDDKVLVLRTLEGIWKTRHFAGWREDGKICTFLDGRTSWSSNNDMTTTWDEWKLPDDVE